MLLELRNFHALPLSLPFLIIACAAIGLHAEGDTGCFLHSTSLIVDVDMLAPAFPGSSVCAKGLQLSANGVVASGQQPSTPVLSPIPLTPPGEGTGDGGSLASAGSGGTSASSTAGGVASAVSTGSLGTSASVSGGGNAGAASAGAHGANTASAGVGLAMAASANGNGGTIATATENDRSFSVSVGPNGVSISITVRNSV